MVKYRKKISRKNFEKIEVFITKEYIMKKFIITEEERRSIRKMYLKEEEFDPTVDHEAVSRIKTLSIDKNGVATVVLELWKNRYKNNSFDSELKDGQDGITLSVDSRCQKYDSNNQKVPVKYERKGKTFTNSDILTLPEGCRVDISGTGNQSKKINSYALQGQPIYCGSGNCMSKGVTAKKAELNPEIQTPPENQTI